MRPVCLGVVAGLAGLLAAACVAPAGHDAAPPARVLLLTPDWGSAIDDEVAARAVREVFAAAGYGDDQAQLSTGRISDERAVAEEQLQRIIRARSPDVVITQTTGIARDLQRLHPQLPVAFSGPSDPVGSCLVDSMMMPGRNASGYASDVPVEAKMVEFLLEAFPAVRDLIVLVDGNLSESIYECSSEQERLQMRSIAARGCAAGPVVADDEIEWLVDLPRYREALAVRSVSAEYWRVCDWGDVVRFAARRLDAKTSGVIVPNRLLFQQHAGDLVALLNGSGVPAMYEGLRFAEQGGLMAVGAPLRLLRETTEVAMLSLAGEPMARIPVRTPSRVDLWINISAAARGGQYPVLRVLRRADRLIR